MSHQAQTWVIKHSRQKGAPLLVLYLMANHAHPDGTNACAGIRTLAHESRMSERQVKRIISEKLIPSGEVTAEPDAGARGTTVYALPGVSLNGPVPLPDKMAPRLPDKMAPRLPDKMAPRLPDKMSPSTDTLPDKMSPPLGDISENLGDISDDSWGHSSVTRTQLTQLTQEMKEHGGGDDARTRTRACEARTRTRAGTPPPPVAWPLKTYSPDGETQAALIHRGVPEGRLEEIVAAYVAMRRTHPEKSLTPEQPVSDKDLLGTAAFLMRERGIPPRASPPPSYAQQRQEQNERVLAEWMERQEAADAARDVQQRDGAALSGVRADPGTEAPRHVLGPPEKPQR